MWKKKIHYSFQRDWEEDAKADYLLKRLWACHWLKNLIFTSVARFKDQDVRAQNATILEEMTRCDWDKVWQINWQGQKVKIDWNFTLKESNSQQWNWVYCIWYSSPTITAQWTECCVTRPWLTEAQRDRRFNDHQNKPMKKVRTASRLWRGTSSFATTC